MKKERKNRHLSRPTFESNAGALDSYLPCIRAGKKRATMAAYVVKRP